VRIFILGATGRTGRHLTEQALLRGHTVTAMVRRPNALIPHAGLRITEGDPVSDRTLEEALPGHDVIISCLGRKRQADAGFLRNAAAAMLAAMAGSEVHRYLVVSQGLLFPNRNPIIPILRIVLAKHLADSAAMEHLVRASETDWTIARPPMLVDGGAPCGYRVSIGGLPAGAWSMQRADLATFLLDEADRGEHVRLIVGLASG